ncbi:MAG: hypothetical protein ABMB14_22185, partial [Myxococcota bacterium]
VPPPMPLATAAGWTEACGECHLAYHPSLLPARSWDRMLADQADHFGEDLGFDAPTVATLSGIAHGFGADLGATEHAARVAAEEGTPASITDSATWNAEHARLAFGPDDHPSRCLACHADAEVGSFDGATITTDATDATNTNLTNGGS